MFKVNRKAVSEVLGILLVTTIITTVSLAYLAFAVQNTSVQVSSFSDVIKQAQRKVSILLSLTYYEKKGDTIHLYIYNYGTLDAKIFQLYVQGDRVRSFMVRDMNTGNIIGDGRIPVGKLVDLYFTGNLSGETEIFLVTEEFTTFSWKITL